jgi:cobalt transporter subunit CbtA
MIFQRLIWAGLAAAVVVGSVQTGIQRWQAAPLILAAEVYEAQKVEAAPAPESMTAHVHAEGAAPAHKHAPGTAKEWEPENGIERTAWTWVANVLHAFSMALLVFAVMGVYLYKRGAALASLPLASLVAVAGWLSFHFWPSLGLPAEVPGMDAAPLHARQIWWVLAVGSAALACAVLGFARSPWRWTLAAVLLALPFVVGAPPLQGDALAGYGVEAHAALAQLGTQFIWATTWVALSFWITMGLACGLAFQRWLRPVLLATFERAKPVTAASAGLTS